MNYSYICPSQYEGWELEIKVMGDTEVWTWRLLKGGDAHEPSIRPKFVVVGGCVSTINKHIILWVKNNLW